MTTFHHRHERGPDDESLRYRYATFRRKLPKQISDLQNNKAFRERCKELYERGYKDWMILGALLNWIVQPVATSAAGMKTAMQRTEERIRSDQPLNDRIEPEELCGEAFQRCLDSFNFLLLTATYGFELNRRRLDPRIAERFLAERLGYFERDLPHAPLFGTEPGGWPKGTETLEAKR